MEEIALEFDLGSFNGTLDNGNSSVGCFNDTLLVNSSWSELCPTSNDSIMYKDPSYYAIPYRIIGTIFQGFILLVGK